MARKGQKLERNEKKELIRDISTKGSLDCFYSLSEFKEDLKNDLNLIILIYNNISLLFLKYKIITLLFILVSN